MSKEGNPSSAGIEALRRRFEEQSRKAQTYYTIMHQYKKIAGNDDAASAWMEAALPELGGKTPAELVNEGREDAVLAHIKLLKA